MTLAEILMFALTVAMFSVMWLLAHCCLKIGKVYLPFAGMLMVTLGMVSNGFVKTINGGRMPVWETNATIAKLVRESSRHIPVDAATRFIPLSDVIPIGSMTGMMSIGDLFLIGGFVCLLAGMVLFLEGDKYPFRVAPLDIRQQIDYT